MTRRALRGTRWACLALTVAGCSANFDAVEAGNDSSDPVDGTGDTFAADTGLVALGPSLRIVVEPALEDADEGLILPQTFGPYEDARDFTLVLQPAVTFAGRVNATIPDPWPGLLPSDPVQPDGEILLFSTSTGRRWETALFDGTFSTQVPPGVYTRHVLVSQALVPSFFERIDVSGDTNVVVDAPEGLPVWGRVIEGSGLPAVGVSVSIRTAIGERGARTTTDTQGWYELRAVSGPATLEVQPATGLRLPTLDTPILVDREGGARVDLAWANTGTIAVSARVTTVEGVAIPNLPMRLSSTDLVGYDLDAASWSVDASTDSNGFIDARVPPGTYTLSARPDADTPFTARAVSGLDLTDDADLGDVLIPGLLTTAVRVRAPSGESLVDASLTCRELGGRQRTFLGRTGPEGDAAMSLPDAVVDCLVTPPPSYADALAPTRVRRDAVDLATVDLPVGEALAGTIVVEQADGGRRPEPFAVVRVLNDDDQLLAQTVTGNDGAFEVRVDIPYAE